MLLKDFTTREDFIGSIPNVSYLNDSEAEEQNAKDLMGVIDEDYLYACGDIFTKMFENDDVAEWGCKNSFYKISLNKDGSDCSYGEANMLPNCIEYYE